MSVNGTYAPTVRMPRTIGITSCVTPPPRLPHPAVVAFAVPTTFGANMTDVWYCVMTNDAPTMPISRWKIRNVWKSCARPMPITGSDPTRSSQVYASRGPIRSHSQPISSLATTVTATDPMMIQPICDCVSPISSRTSIISGAMPNQAKKQRKNANQLMWNARICGVEKLKTRIRTALPVTSIAGSLRAGARADEYTRRKVAIDLNERRAEQPGRRCAGPRRSSSGRH